MEGTIYKYLWPYTRKQPIRLLDKIPSVLIIGGKLWLKIGLKVHLKIVTGEFGGNRKSYNGTISLKGSAEETVMKDMEMEEEDVQIEQFDLTGI